ncbi:MAG: hypothetical protein JSU69_09410 [Candidatus Zixiibacteriota bacterium]|nr:MAG: hypothetical protein JSU69_09410 [candidate division Zixibacteria bacterium]
MSVSKTNHTLLELVILTGLAAIMPAHSLLAQGSIFGTVANSDMSVPGDNEIYFVGYLDDTDEEIRIESSVGAGYDNGNWFDDFQNYLTEAPGNPYDYHFFNVANGETAVLSKLIPNNSFQQENIQLAASSWPMPPAGLNGIPLNDTAVEISWEYQSGLTYRIYRREALSEGSFFRIDDPTGSMSNPGVSDSLFIDNDIDTLGSFDYLVIPLENDVIGLHSEIITVETNPAQFVCGDTDSSGVVNILDVMYIITFLYKSGPEPKPMASADVDNRP